MKDLSLIIFKAGHNGFIITIFGSTYLLSGLFFYYIKLRLFLYYSIFTSAELQRISCFSNISFLKPLIKNPNNVIDGYAS